jgi:hypothetical protein
MPASLCGGTFSPFFRRLFSSYAPEFLNNIPESPKQSGGAGYKTRDTPKTKMSGCRTRQPDIVLNYLRNPSFSISARYL